MTSSAVRADTCRSRRSAPDTAAATLLVLLGAAPARRRRPPALYELYRPRALAALRAPAGAASGASAASSAAATALYASVPKYENVAPLSRMMPFALAGLPRAISGESGDQAVCVAGVVREWGLGEGCGVCRASRRLYDAFAPTHPHALKHPQHMLSLSHNTHTHIYTHTHTHTRIFTQPLTCDSVNGTPATLKPTTCST